MTDYGRIIDTPYVEKLVASLSTPVIPDRLIRQEVQRDVLLWKAKDKAQPNWRRAWQGIGDCVSWGAELACTCQLWNMAAKGELEFLAEAATESIYGGCRVEVHGGKPAMRYNEDGAAGSWAADWLKSFGGVLLRLDYSQQTGNPEHDLRKYSAKRAQDWGYYGNGGKIDKGVLDKLAKVYPVKDIAMVKNSDQCSAAIDAGCTVTVASNVGYEGKRDSQGIIRRNGEWGHQMCILGKKYLPNGDRLHRLFNSNPGASGPDPDIDDEEISRCSWWIVDEDLDKQLREEDSFAFSSVEGFTQAPFNFDNIFV